MSKTQTAASTPTDQPEAAQPAPTAAAPAAAPAEPAAPEPDAHHGSGGLYVIGTDGRREPVEATRERD